MEAILDKAETVLHKLQEALDAYEAMESSLDKLEKYYENNLWCRDFEDDCSGKLPQDLKRGVLSEDGIWNVLTAGSNKKIGGKQ